LAALARLSKMGIGVALAFGDPDLLPIPMPVA
jgi:hypothetical protein